MFPVALALDLLLLPPVGGDGDLTICTECSPHRADPVIDRCERHHVQCGHGIRLSGTCHDPTVQALVPILDAVFGTDRVTAERGGPRGREAMDAWMVAHPIAHRPDAVVRDFDGAGTWLLIDIKTLDAAGTTHITTHHTDRTRLTAHVAAARHSIQQEYGALPPRMRVIIIAVSATGAIGLPGRRFLGELGRRVGDGLPSALLDQASWAVPRLAPFARMALGFAVRRGLAESIYRRWRRVATTADIRRAVAAAPLVSIAPAAPGGGAVLAAPVVAPVALVVPAAAVAPAAVAPAIGPVPPQAPLVAPNGAGPPGPAGAGPAVAVAAALFGDGPPGHGLHVD